MFVFQFTIIYLTKLRAGAILPTLTIDSFEVESTPLLTYDEHALPSLPYSSEKKTPPPPPLSLVVPV